MNITVVCVNAGDYLGRGKQYADTLYAMVQRNLRRPFGFYCFEDRASTAGWWAKVELFRPGLFTGRIVYFDLDSVIVGPLDELVETKGIIDLADWGWETHTLCSSVMVWDADEHRDIFECFTPEVPKRLRGDQDWITELGRWPVLPSHLCRSYRYHCVKGPPADCVHVSCHGVPKPHEIRDGWVPKAWRA